MPRHHSPLAVLAALSVLALSLDSRIVINEFVASNSTTLVDGDGDSADWIEMYNAGPHTVNLEGYGFTDDRSRPFRWVFPDVDMESGAFLIVWASGKDLSASLHTNFRLSSGGEPLQLTAPDGTIEDSVDPVSVPRDISYGRVPDGADAWFYFDEPTPGAANTSPGYNEPVSMPVLSHEPGFYADTVHVEAFVPDFAEAQIHYTIDGSRPTLDSPLYTAPISVADRTGDPNDLSTIATATPGSGYWNWSGPPAEEVYKINVLRLRAFKPDHLPSLVTSASYIIGQEAEQRYSLPVVSIVSGYDSFFDPGTGLFVNGNYHERGEEWERESHIEFFEDGALGFAQDVGVRIHGGWSRRAPIKSLRIYARGRYGKRVIDYPIFREKATRTFERLILRSGGSDWAKLPMRDGFAQSLIRGISDVSHQHYRPVVVFINGEYWGIHNIRDRYDGKYLEHEYGVLDADILTDIDTVKQGSNADYLDLYDFLADEDMDDSDNYRLVREQIDVANFRDYHIAQVYYMNIDQPGKNADFWRSQTVRKGHPHADGRWRWLLYDVDNSYGFLTGYAPPDRSGLIFCTSLNHIDATALNPKSTVPSYAPNTPAATLPLRRMLQNTEFRTDFINRFADLLNTVFSSEFATARLAEIQAEVEPYVPEHLNRWGKPSMQRWLSERNRVYRFATDRPGYMRDDIQSFFGLGATTPITVDVAGGSDRGYIRVNSIEITGETPGVAADPYPWTGIYFGGVSVRLRAIPAPGFQFAGWEEFPSESSDTLVILPQSEMTVTAIFEPARPSTLIHYWNFNEPGALVEPTDTMGGAELALMLGPDSMLTYDDGQEFFGGNARGGDEPGTHLRLNNPLGAVITIALPTTGYEQPVLQYESRRSGQGAGIQYLSYTIDGTSFEPLDTVVLSNSAPTVFRFDLRNRDGVADNPDFAIRMAFDTGSGGTAGNNRIDNLTLEGREIETATIFDQSDSTLDMGQGWKWNELGYLYDRHFPFVYLHGISSWVYVFGDDEASYYFWSFTEAHWAWIGRDHYPRYYILTGNQAGRWREL